MTKQFNNSSSLNTHNCWKEAVRKSWKRNCNKMINFIMQVFKTDTHLDAIGIRMESPRPSGHGRYKRDDSDFQQGDSCSESSRDVALIHLVLFRRVEKRHLLRPALYRKVLPRQPDPARITF